MYNQTDEIRQDRTKLNFFYSMEELLKYFAEVRSKRKVASQEDFD